MPSTFVPPSGDPFSPYVIVAEQPGHQEVRYRRPFMGPAGDNLNQCLHSAQILRSECYLTNVIKDLDHPLEFYMTLTGGKREKAIVTPSGQEYIELLRNELALTTASIIIACGNVALYALTSRVGITRWRGSVLDSTLLPGRKVIATIHPATWTGEKLHENPGAYLNKFLVSFDLKRAKQESMYPEIRESNRRLITRPTYHAAVDFLALCIREGLQGAIIDYDIEIQPYNQELSCIGLSWDKSFAMCIPFIDSNGDTMSIEQELDIMLGLEQLFSDARIHKRGQNVIFDSHYLLRKYGIRTRSISHDTMIAQGISMPEFRKGLDFITSIHTDIPYYKSDGKIWLGGGGDWENGWRYNCLDVLSTATASPNQLNDLIEQNNMSVYKRQVRLIPPLTYMMERGIKVDLTGMAQAAKECRLEIGELTRQIGHIMQRDCVPDSSYMQTKKEFNLGSLAQLCNYFYVEKGHAPYLNPDTHRPTIDVTALTRLSNGGYEEASLILKMRKLSKKVSTFLDTSQVDPDGRIRCSYNPVGTKYGRISSSENIFGTGTNLQNQPHDVLTYFVVDDGYIGYSLDMSQIENRIVARVGNILPMIEAFENGQDVHRLTAQMVLRIMGADKSMEEITSDERQDFGKRPNHAFNYGYGYKSFSLKYEVPEYESRRIHRAYHAAYPGLENSYWAYVQQQLKEHRQLRTLLDRTIPFYGFWSAKLLHEAYSAIPQSTCGDHVNERGINFTYYNNDPDFRPVELLTQVHDSLEIQIPLSIPLAQHARVLTKMKASLETPLEWRGQKFVVPVDLTVGICLNKEIGIELKGSKFSSNSNLLESELYQAITKFGLEIAI